MNEWISVKDRMPKKGVYVRIHPAYTHWNSHPIHAAQLVEIQKCFLWVYMQGDSSHNCHNVTHWKPITEPALRGIHNRG